MKKRILALSLALSLSLTPALAAGTTEQFPATNPYSGFSDVTDSHWAKGGIQICYETGLMKGKGAGFDPEGTVTTAEAIAVAARVGATLRGDTVPAPTDNVWYSGAVAYLTALPRGNEIDMSGDLSQRSVSRWGLLRYLSIAVPETALVSKNTITSLPDIDDADVLRFYNAGVLTGINSYGTFSPRKSLTRAEMSAMLSRIARPETALSFTPKAKDAHDPLFDPVAYYLGMSGTTIALKCEDKSFTMTEFLSHYCAAANNLVTLCKEQGVEFSWDLAFEDGTTFRDYAKDTAVGQCVHTWWEGEYGGDKLDTSNIWGAKHILVDTKEQSDKIRALLKTAKDSETTFNELMAEHSTDPGLQSNPNGYTFGPGEMVAEFEAGTKALKVGEISQPIQSQFGWHIILRIQPDEASVQQKAYKAWVNTQDFRYTSALNSVDLPTFYNWMIADQK